MKCSKCGEQGHNAKTCGRPRVRVVAPGVSGRDLGGDAPPAPRGEHTVKRAAKKAPVAQPASVENEVVVRLRILVSIES